MYLLAQPFSTLPPQWSRTERELLVHAVVDGISLHCPEQAFINRLQLTALCFQVTKVDLFSRFLRFSGFANLFSLCFIYSSYFT